MRVALVKYRSSQARYWVISIKSRTLKMQTISSILSLNTCTTAKHNTQKPNRNFPSNKLGAVCSVVPKPGITPHPSPLDNEDKGKIYVEKIVPGQSPHHSITQYQLRSQNPRNRLRTPPLTRPELIHNPLRPLRGLFTVTCGACNVDPGPLVSTSFAFTAISGCISVTSMCDISEFALWYRHIRPYPVENSGSRPLSHR